MARGNLILGQGAGKLGDVVLFRNAGQQQARAYVSNPKNPKTYKQALQRSKFASVALAYQYFKLIIDRSTRYKNGRTAYNEFLKNNISVAPYASKSERQEWAGLYSLPAQWTLAFGALARPEVWAVASATGTGSSITSLTLGDANQLCRDVLAYALANGWLPANPAEAYEQQITPTQLAEAMAGATNCHVIIMTSGAAQVGDYNDSVNSGGARILELTADKLATLAAVSTFSFEEGEWSFDIGTADFTLIGAGGTLTIPNDSGSGGTVAKPITITSISGGNYGLSYATWIGNNSGTAVQVSNIIVETAGTTLTTTATNRRDVSEPETDAAIASWQVEEAAGSDSAIY